MQDFIFRQILSEAKIGTKYDKSILLFLVFIGYYCSFANYLLFPKTAYFATFLGNNLIIRQLHLVLDFEFIRTTKHILLWLQ